MRRTKIVATIGPASRDVATLERMIEAGMDVARLNYSHGTLEEHAETVRRLAADLWPGGEVVLGRDPGAKAVGDVDLVVHPGRHTQAGPASLMHEDGVVIARRGELRDQWRLQRRGHARVARVRLDRLVGQQIRLHDQLQVLVQRFDLVSDRDHRALSERDQPPRVDPDPPTCRRRPHGVAGQRPGAEVEYPVVLEGAAVPHVQRLVLDQQPDDLAVGHVDHGLAGFRVAVPAFGVGQAVFLVEAIEVGARQAARLRLLERAAQADVPVGQRERRFSSLQRVHVQASPAQLPR